MIGKAHRCRRARNRWTLLALLVVLLPPLSGAAPPVEPPEALKADAFLADGARRTHVRSDKVRIGRIFFSPAERRRRDADKTPATDAPSTRHARPERLEINGSVNSSTQERVVWVNGVPIENSANVKSAWTERAGGVWLRNDGRAPRLLRPGQAIDRASGAIEDLLPIGSVARH